MKKLLVLLIGIAVATFVAVTTVTSSAQQQQQQQQPAPPDKIFIERMATERIGPEGPPPPPGAGDFMFFATEMSFGGKLVKGAPYSAQVVTENNQTLFDGNRIINKSTGAIYRDSEGRTRREQSLRSIGPFANSGEVSQTIFISDPVAGTSYTLDQRSHVARKMPPLRFKFEYKTPPPEGAKSETEEVQQGKPGQAAMQVFVEKRTVEGGVAMGWVGAKNQDARTESLGKQNIEGVEAEGTRTTVTIPAGDIGNERPIEIVSERWYSPELQTIVMTHHSDPRFGETNYRLTNINRSEQPKSLFEVPADYTIKEGPKPPPEPMRMRTPGE